MVKCSMQRNATIRVSRRERRLTLFAGRTFAVLQPCFAVADLEELPIWHQMIGSCQGVLVDANAAGLSLTAVETV